MGEEFKFGQTDLGMKATGRMTKLMEEEDLFMLTEMSMKANGRMTKVKDMECISIQTGLSTRENGLRINRKVMVLKLGQMVRSMKEGTKTE